MSETTLTAIVVAALASLPPTLVALKGLLETRRNRREVTAAAVDNAAQNEVLIEKSEDIHKLVNSDMSRVKSDLEMANKRIGMLQDLVTKLVAEREDQAKS